MAKAEIRAVGELSFSMDGDRPRIEARAIQFDSWSVDLGGFRERILPNSIELDSDLVALFDHATDKVLGRVSAGTMTVRTDSKGVSFTAYPPETSWARDLRVSMERGDIKGCSFRMFVDEDAYYVEAGEVRRDIRKARVTELTVTSMPAYPETSAEARSHVEALASEVTPPVIEAEERAGRVLSNANENALKNALDAISVAGSTIETVLSQLDSNEIESEDEVEDDENEVEIEITDSETMDGASKESRRSVGATENNPTRSLGYSSKFGIITTSRKEN